MSNFLAMATVTAALSEVLHAAVMGDVGGGLVTTLRPDDSSGLPSVGANVFLYQVVPNASWRNADLPTRNGRGSAVQRPRAAIDLAYLISVYGADAQQEPQRVLGSILRTLHARPLLTRDDIRSTISKTIYSYLAASNLAEDVELVRFTPMPLSLEEMSKLWSIYFQTPYRLSVAYQASVVLLESEEAAQAALPVQRRNIYVLPLEQPVVESVGADTGGLILAQSKVVIRGRKLKAELTDVYAGELTALTLAKDITDTAIRSTLPAGLRAGVQGLQVVHPLPMGTPAVPHRGTESNLFPFVLHPKVLSTSFAAPNVSVRLDPPVGAAQRVLLSLNELNPPSGRDPHAFVLPAQTRMPGSPDADALVFAAAAVPPGNYLVQVRVDGATSALEPGPDPNEPGYTGPKVTIS